MHKMRQAPRLLSYHLGMAASHWQRRLSKGESDAKDIQKDYQDMLRGIQMYLSHPYSYDDAHLDVVFSDGCASIMALKGHDYEVSNPSLLLIPSLINKASIFDLTKTRSMLRYACAQGVNAYLLDWGVFLDDPDMQDIESVVSQKLLTMMTKLSQAANGADIHALGYCMGGTLLAGLAATHNAPLKSLIFMATPWDFHAGSQDLLRAVQFWAPSLLPSLKDHNHMKVDWLQLLFASLNPQQSVSKFIKFAGEDMDSEAAQIFVAIEDWVNDGVPLPYDIANACVNEWFLRNTIVGNAWKINDHIVRAGNIKNRCLVIASSQDHLVEEASSLALYAALNNAQILDPQCGHIGMIAGRHAIENLWRPIMDWVKSNEKS